MHADDDALRGRPLDAAETAIAEELSAWAESKAFDIGNPEEILVGPEAAAAGRSLMESIVGEEALDRAINRGGRPSLSGTTGSGASPKRQVRLPREVDERLLARASREHRDISDLMREAIVAYLDTGSRR
ncbi:ribbon-helix-helix protein, CopG family [Agromyces aerolatus]|uniref:ribbon-helix-helix protein, CopG family n=1 Tax=Agromyces sp. LY-1074 TaxID=3074080 RepID=UPI00285D057D|nr:MULTISPECIES: ribbon-helix-helix protein, CopG family [unclassified Agromyces]MDR5698272.1 ribbon-helix-helix protein, CopG family [Agromyces sp. LY-1074]MDR5704566.1 ribbon-helix-helix protein, CopG family [Agromyces sp. LY-1358]